MSTAAEKTPAGASDYPAGASDYPAGAFEMSEKTPAGAFEMSEKKCPKHSTHPAGASFPAGETPWQQEPPDAAGLWLWIELWDCGCVLRIGLAEVTSYNPDPGENPEIQLPNGFHLLPLTYHLELLKEPLAGIAAWRKIVLPPLAGACGDAQPEGIPPETA